MKAKEIQMEKGRERNTEKEDDAEMKIHDSQWVEVLWLPGGTLQITHALPGITIIFISDT